MVPGSPRHNLIGGGGKKARRYRYRYLDRYHARPQTPDDDTEPMSSRPRRETKPPKALVDESPERRPPRPDAAPQAKTPGQKVVAAAKRLLGGSKKKKPAANACFEGAADAAPVEARPVAKQVKSIAAALAAAASPAKKKQKKAPLAAPQREGGLADCDVNLYVWKAREEHDMSTAEMAVALGEGRSEQSLKDRLQRMRKANVTRGELEERVALRDSREAMAKAVGSEPTVAVAVGSELLAGLRDAAAAPAPAAAKPPPKKKDGRRVPYYINIMGGPQAPAETQKDLGARPMSKSRKVKLVHAAIDLLGDTIDADCRRWEQVRLRIRRVARCVHRPSVPQLSPTGRASRRADARRDETAVDLQLCQGLRGGPA